MAETTSHKTPAEIFPAWDYAYSKLSSEYPDKEIRMYQNEADIVVGGCGNQQATDTYKINPANGEVSSVTTYEDKAESIISRDGSTHYMLVPGSDGLPKSYIWSVCLSVLFCQLRVIIYG